MAFTAEQIETLQMLFKLTSAQRNRALQLAIQEPKTPASPAIRRVQNNAARCPITPPSSDSSLSASSTTGSEGSGSAKKRLHSKNRITRLASKLCKIYLNSERMWAHLYGDNNRIIEHRLENVLHQIKTKLTHKEQKTFKTYNQALMKDLKKKMAANKTYRLKRKEEGQTMEEAHKAVTIDLSLEGSDDESETEEAGDQLPAVKKIKTEQPSAEPRERQPKPPAVQPPTESPQNPPSGEHQPSPKVKVTRRSLAQSFRQDMDTRKQARKARGGRTKVVSRKARGLHVHAEVDKRKRSASSPAGSSTTSVSPPADTGVPRKRSRARKPKKRTDVPKTFKFTLGTKVARDFGGETFAGEITKLYEDDHTMCEVTYTDGDKEDLDTDELEYGKSLFLTI
jgi:hypothetical protein